MSIDIAWDNVTSGPDGEALAENVRAFVHTKFQQIVLPRFIKSVHVHSFEFGSACPEIEIKDIGDPLPDFYEDEEDGDDADSTVEDSGDLSLDMEDRSSISPDIPGAHLAPRLDLRGVGNQSLNEEFSNRPPTAHVFLPPPDKRHMPKTGGDALGGHFARSGTPGIPGGTSNMSYFHMPMAGLSGTETPLAAVASGTPLSSAAWHVGHPPPFLSRPGRANPGEWEFVDPSTRPSTANTLPSPPDAGSPLNPSSPENQPLRYPTAEKVSDDPMLESRFSPPPLRLHQSQPQDLQVVARVHYSGDVRMTLTAEILLDYPMPSFVGIPLKLSITGMTFDGVAILASIKKRMHFCFLDPEDADALVGDHIGEELGHSDKSKDGQQTRLAGLLKEIRVESEIGRQESGKQVLKNVGKVEKFVLEQVRRIFEEEFVFPSFWTILV